MLVQAFSPVCLALLSLASFSPLLCFPFPNALTILILAAGSKLTRNDQRSLSSPLWGRVVADTCSNSQCAPGKIIQALCSFKIKQNQFSKADE